MGTSSARRAPTTRLWRLAKGAATRYMSPEGGGSVTAGEVVARYVAALEESGGAAEASALAAWRLTRKVGQDLGAWAAQIHSQGWQAALAARGLEPLASEPPEIVTPGLSAALGGKGGSLEEAVARTALTEVLRGRGTAPSSLPDQDPGSGAPAPGKLVGQFLATALYLRLALDLGEPLEAAAPSLSRLLLGMAGIRQPIEHALDQARIAAAEPRSPEQWSGLAGWTWVTGMVQELVRQLKQAREAPVLPEKAVPKRPGL